jgi:N-acetylglucosamine-6-phosphate deacetylase
MLRLAFRLLGEDRAVVVSDAVAAAGLPEGAHEINGCLLRRKNGAVYLEDGQTLAGSASDLYAEFRNLLRWGVAPRAALKACSINPARVVGAARHVGSLAPGKQADVLFADENWNLQQVMLRGVLQEKLQA